MKPGTDLVTGNIFRILALHVSASEREVISRVDELRTVAAIGRTASFPLDRILPAAIQRDTASIDTCAEVWRNPLRRCEHALMWFWECTSLDTRALATITNGQTEAAAVLWRSAAQGSIARDTVSQIKNAATAYTFSLFQPDIGYKKFCMNHARACDIWRDLCASPLFAETLRTITGCTQTALGPEYLTGIVEAYMACLRDTRKPPEPVIPGPVAASPVPPVKIPGLKAAVYVFGVLLFFLWIRHVGDHSPTAGKPLPKQSNSPYRIIKSSQSIVRTLSQEEILAEDDSEVSADREDDISESGYDDPYNSEDIELWEEDDDDFDDDETGPDEYE